MKLQETNTNTILFLKLLSHFHFQKQAIVYSKSVQRNNRYFFKHFKIERVFKTIISGSFNCYVTSCISCISPPPSSFKLYLPQVLTIPIMLGNEFNLFPFLPQKISTLERQIKLNSK